MVKNLPINAEDSRDTGSIPESGRSPGEGNGNTFQYSCLENPNPGRNAHTTLPQDFRSELQSLEKQGGDSADNGGWVYSTPRSCCLRPGDKASEDTA